MEDIKEFLLVFGLITLACNLAAGCVLFWMWVGRTLGFQ